MSAWNATHTSALTTAQSWVGDSIRVQATEDLGTAAVAWRIELSAPPPAEIIQALGATGEISVDASGNRLPVTVSDSQSPVT